MQRIKGIAVSHGIIVGRAFLVGTAEQVVPHRIIAESEVPAQLERLHQSLRAAAAQIEELRERTQRELGTEPAKIFEFHAGLLRDKSLVTAIERRIGGSFVTAEQAVADQFRQLVDQFRRMGNAVFEQKSNDILDLERRVLGQLMGEQTSRLAQLAEPAVIVAHELTPSQAAAMDRSKVIALATDLGGRTSHTSIVARALGLPAVVGCQKLAATVEDGDMVVVDGNEGVVVVRPDSRTLEDYRRRQERSQRSRAALRELSGLEAVTKDGVRINLMGNIEFPEEVSAVLANGGDGVGLYRTEFLWLTRQDPPTEEDHYQAYLRTLSLLQGKPLTIRTCDLGADKYTQAQMEEPERNPFLGLRSIRHSLANPGEFKAQLRAILRASAHGPVKVMFPLVSNPMELRQAKLMIADISEELEDEGIPFDRQLPVGVMIEVPSAALMSRVLATESSFFSIGTNDLVQYTLAVDRGNERVAHLYNAAHPAVVYLTKTIIRSARAAQIDCSCCGEAAGEPVFSMLLLGLGLRTLSMVPDQIPVIKRVVRSVTMEQCERLARKVGSFDSERLIETAMRDELRKLDPEVFGHWLAE
ncbi:MAG: phosphoenolpyruvate--protein phosphotransferase [Phycisphaerales bacterium]